MKTLKKVPKARSWYAVKLRGSTYLKIREVAGAVAWDGWGNLPEPWRSAWAKLDSPVPGIDAVVDVAVSVFQASIAEARKNSMEEGKR